MSAQSISITHHSPKPAWAFGQNNTIPGLAVVSPHQSHSIYDHMGQERSQQMSPQLYDVYEPQGGIVTTVPTQMGGVQAFQWNENGNDLDDQGVRSGPITTPIPIEKLNTYAGGADQSPASSIPSKASESLPSVDYDPYFSTSYSTSYPPPSNLEVYGDGSYDYLKYDANSALHSSSLETQIVNRHYDMEEEQTRRRKNHNAVERRRRDNINEQIKTLEFLLPAYLKPDKSNKGNTLNCTVKFIKDLIEDRENIKRQFGELEKELNVYKHTGPSS